MSRVSGGSSSVFQPLSPRYQAQMKESQGSQSSAVRDAALMREEAALVRSRNEQLSNQVQGLQQQLLLQRDDLLKEKQLMVAKLEMLEDPSDEESVESRSTPQRSVDDERMFRIEEKLQEAESALVADKEAMEEMARLKKELDDQSHYLKESVIKEEGHTKAVLLDLNESKEEVQRLTAEIQRRTDAAKSKDVQIIKMNLDIQSLGQAKTLLEDQLSRTISELEKSSCNYLKLKQQIMETNSEKEKLVFDMEQMKDIAKELANNQKILQGLRNENIEIKRVNLKIEPLSQENAHLVDKLKALQLDADLNRDKTEQLDILRRENESLQESMQSSLHQVTILTTKCEENSSIGSEAEKLMLALGLENVKLIDQVAEAEKQMETLLEIKNKENEMLRLMQTENYELQTKLDMHEKQFNDEKVDLERVIQQLENVQDKLLNDKSHGVSFREELFEDLQNSDRENKEKIKILDSSLKHYEIRLNEQTSIKEACLREMDELREVEGEQQNLIRMQKDKMRRLEAEITGLKEENKRKEESLNTCRVDLLQLEKEKGMLSAVSYENRALKENCSLLEKSLEKFNDCQGKVSILEHSLFKSQETVHDKEEKIGDLQTENTELRKKVKDMSRDLSSERQEAQRLKISLEAANKLIERVRNKEISDREELETLNCNIKKLHDEKLLLEKSHQGSTDVAAELKIQLESKHHMENVLEDRMKSLNLHLQDKNQTISLLKKEAGHKEELHRAEIAQMAFKNEKIQKNFSAR